MMRRYNSKALRIEFAAPTTQCIIISIVAMLLGILFLRLPRYNEYSATFFGNCALFSFIIATVFLAVGIVLMIFKTEESKICHKIRVGLYYQGFGNPLHLNDHEYCPKIKVEKISTNKFLLKIFCTSVTVDDLNKAASVLSSLLNKKQKRYAVTLIDSDIAYNFVQFTIEDVTVDKSFTFHSSAEMTPGNPTKFNIQKDDSIDLTTSGSILVAGKTRSGKTTGVISIVLQALLCGRDEYFSSIIIIDPKRAELSMLPHTITVDDDGEATAILQALKDFEDTIKRRQKYLNSKSLEVGDAVHWWDVSMHPSFLFIDEYVACRTLFPKKADKCSDYSIATFDNTLKRIVTMGASAGCFVILSIAEASVEEGGLPSMLKNAMTTKILFKPTLSEGRLMWDSSKLENFPERVYSAGDCWFSSTDGEHDNVTYVHFPHLDFPVYQELGNLLRKYYGNSDDGGAPQVGAR